MPMRVGVGPNHNCHFKRASITVDNDREGPVEGEIATTMAGEVTYASDLQRERALQRITLAPSVTVTLDVGADGVCTIGIEGPLLHDSAFYLRHALRADFRDQGVTGLLVDVRYSPTLSIVRLGGLLEALSEFCVPLAALLSSESQRQLAGLLHNTLAHVENVAYFIDFDAALDYVRDAAMRATDTVQ